jgi:hypothetical protein
MFVPETVVIEVYVMVDELSLTALPPERRRRGQQPALSRSEVVTLALLSQLECFPSERAFYRFVDAQWRHLFPRLPDRSQLNRAIRAQHDALVALGRACARCLDALTAPYEVLDTTVVAVRSAKRRGVGTMPEVGAIGYSTRSGWVNGIRLLAAVTPDAAITGWGIAPANAGERAMADVVLAERATPVQTLPSAGRAASGLYLADTGFGGRAARQRWLEWGADVLASPQPDSGERWSVAMRAVHTSKRQIVETVFGRLKKTFRLERDRPRTLDGLLARIAAKVAGSNLLIRLNQQAGRPGLTTVGVVL